MMTGMSIADESQVSHRPPQVGDRVEVRLQGTVAEVRNGMAWVVIGSDQLEDEETSTWQPVDQVAILRDIPRYRPGHADRP
jgi:hypothetical protein